MNTRLYHLSFFKYAKEKLKEILSISGRRKGDIFLNPTLKSGAEILREGIAADHIIQAIKYFKTHHGYDAHYCDLNASFGAIATELCEEFPQMSLREDDPLLRQVLEVNMQLKSSTSNWKIYPARQDMPQMEKAIIRAEAVEQIEPFLLLKDNIIILQITEKYLLKAPHHDLYLYAVDMDKTFPFRALLSLIFKGYNFKLTPCSPPLTEEESALIKGEMTLEAGDYILIPSQEKVV